MTRNPKENIGAAGSFPATAFWEELSTIKEDLGQDYLGADHRGRFEQVDLAARNLSIDERLQVGDIPREMIASLTVMLGLSDPEPLVERLWEIAGRHLRPVHRLLLGSDPKSTRVALLSISSLADRLRGQLDDLAPVVEQYVEAFSNQLPPADSGKVNELSEVRDAIYRLSILAARASNELIGVPNRPRLSIRRQTLTDTVAAVEEHSGQKVEVRWSKGDRKVSEFKNLHGKFVWIFMHMIEPKASEAALANELKIIRNLRAKR